MENNEHHFWSTQPVLQSEDAFDERSSAIDPPKTVEEVSKEPLTIASIFEWWVPNIDNDDDMQQIYVLLRDNYVEDNDSTFRFNYSIEFLRWALSPPGYYHDWHVAVRKKTDKTIMGFISGIPVTVKIGDEIKRICEINFLCVKKSLRERRLAPILIKEVTRRVNLQNIWQAAYTAGKYLPTPFCTANYFHRPINPEKLVETGFTCMPSSYTKFAKPMEMLKRNFVLPNKTHLKKLRPMKETDIPEIARLMREKRENYKFAAAFTDQELSHWLLPRKDVVYCYVNESTTNPGEISDFFSFYNVPSTVIGHPKYKILRAAYLFYCVNTSCPTNKIINDLLIKVRDEHFDVCNCVNILNYGDVVEELKFAPGDGSLHYYFYNWRFPKIKPKECMFVML